MYAVINSGGKQERVAEGQQIHVELLGAEQGSEISLTPMLLVDGESVLATPAELAGATVTANSSQSRSQWRNRQMAWREAFIRLDEAAAPPPPPRARTKPSRGAREARLRDKRAVGARKHTRKRPASDD